ncbi:MAG: triphosphoribosyl-dephospho-CoA synthase [Bacteroidales bacterium]|nr:triphosphoribosyl-dephospho-CoA synthase [Bacteroidales bacterium]
MLDHGPIQELPLSSPFFRLQVEVFLRENGLRMDQGLEHYYAFLDPDGKILAGAGLEADIIKCVAVAPSSRSEGFMLPLLSRVVSDAAAKGILNLKVFTKPDNREIFESIGFRVLASAPKAILMENGHGLDDYCRYLSSICLASGSEKRQPDARKCGVIVMNANPFTLGHKYLIEKALEQVERLYIIPVKEDVSAFPYSERLAMIQASVLPASEQNYFCPSHADARVTVLEGCDYVISAATFPTYFLKDLSEAAETQMRLDLDLFARWIAPALGNPVRFVGSEPSDPLTARYNELMHNAVEIPRLDGISASKVRAAIEAGYYASAAALCPSSTHPYLLAALAERALRIELDTPFKPGLVCPDSCGAHSDMDYGTMLRGISALRPFWSRMALASTAEELRALGIEAEDAMMAATGGVNTHRGAIFALGLAVYAAGRRMETTDSQAFMQNALCKIAQGILRNSLSDSDLHSTLIGARRIALTGYQELFEDWLPFYRSNGPQATLLRIMSTLDDTCVLKRVGAKRAEEVKREAAALLASVMSSASASLPSAEENYFLEGFPKNQFSPASSSPTLADALKELCARYAQEGISPGGAADMLALTIFIDSII